MIARAAFLVWGRDADGRDIGPAEKPSLLPAAWTAHKMIVQGVMGVRVTDADGALIEVSKWGRVLAEWAEQSVRE
ncbi:MAG: hypothetical protein JNL35_02980 [Sphingopyxis sp.]|nr:hypothetical protein [Sphingopyxis sp.]